MKFFKKLFIILFISCIGICIINSQTDFFLNFGSYLPVIEEKYPEASNIISDSSKKLSRLTDKIPSLAEIIATIKNEEMPIDPSDVATNAYTKDSPMLSFFPDENIGIMADFDTVQIFGSVKSANKSHLIAAFTDESGETLEQISIGTNSDNRFNKTITVPETNDLTMNLSIYTGPKAYGQFESWVYNYITLEKTPDGGWQIMQSPVFEHNKVMYEKDKSIKEALKATDSIESDSSAINSIATQLTQNCDNDYDRVLALHDWICSYMYYDVDSLSAEDAPPYRSTEIVQTRKAVCLGFATLMASLCRSIDIPCNVVSGYALGVGTDTKWSDETILTDEQNHAWNEVYVDGRWLIIDTTWDCANKVENGEMIKGTEVSHLYFDANLEFFSANHKILEYSRRR